jgi:hypothetical protein
VHFPHSNCTRAASGFESGLGSFCQPALCCTGGTCHDSRGTHKQSTSIHPTTITTVAQCCAAVAAIWQVSQLRRGIVTRLSCLDRDTRQAGHVAVSLFESLLLRCEGGQATCTHCKYSGTHTDTSPARRHVLSDEPHALVTRTAVGSVGYSAMQCNPNSGSDGQPPTWQITQLPAAASKPQPGAHTAHWLGRWLAVYWVDDPSGHLLQLSEPPCE